MVARDITIGQYMARPTTLHRVDPRLKTVAVLTGSVMVFVYGSGWALLAFAVLLFAVLLACRVPLLAVLRSLRTVWVILLITFLLQALLTPGEVIWRWGFLSVTDTGLSNAVIYSARILLLVVLLGALTMTTPPLRLADGLASLLKPLSFFKVPVGTVTTVVSITLLFVPAIAEKGHRLMQAQAARGADFESANVFRRVADILPLLVPLFVGVFKDAAELATAMDARAYSPGRRTRLYPLKIGGPEALLTLLFIAATLLPAFVL